MKRLGVKKVLDWIQIKLSFSSNLLISVQSNKSRGIMSHLWPIDWYDLSDGKAVLQNISRVWSEKGYDNLKENDYARLEPFLEPFDGIYTDKEIVILSRVGSNGIQKEFCSMFLQPADTAEEVWVLEWYLDPDDIRRIYLKQVARLLYGSNFENDETQSMIMLTHALALLRQLKITIHDDYITGEMEEVPETLVENSFGDPEVITVDEEDFVEEDLLVNESYESE